MLKMDEHGDFWSPVCLYRGMVNIRQQGTKSIQSDQGKTHVLNLKAFAANLRDADDLPIFSANHSRHVESSSISQFAWGFACLARSTGEWLWHFESVRYMLAWYLLCWIWAPLSIRFAREMAHEGQRQSVGMSSYCQESKFHLDGNHSKWRWCTSLHAWRDVYTMSVNECCNYLSLLQFVYQ